MTTCHESSLYGPVCSELGKGITFLGSTWPSIVIDPDRNRSNRLI
jgi:hypothetical protein